MKEIIDKYSIKIRQIIKNYTGSYNEDLEQEVYIKTYKNLEKYKEQNKFSSWICTICANLCKDYLKSFKNKPQIQSVEENETINTLRAKTNIEKELSSKERQKIILKEINKLPKKIKETIVLYEFEDYSYEKIATKLKIPQGTVKSRINNARKILKEKLSFLIEEESND